MPPAAAASRQRRTRQTSYSGRHMKGSGRVPEEGNVLDSSARRRELTSSMPALRSGSSNKRTNLDNSGRFKREMFMCSETDVIGFSDPPEEVTAEFERTEQRSTSFSQNGTILTISSGSPTSGSQQRKLPQSQSEAQRRDSSKENIEPSDESRGISIPTWMEPLNEARIFAGKIVNHYFVQQIILMMIIINAIMMGVATLEVVEENDQLRNIFELVDYIFLVIFTVESAIQLLYYGWTLFKDGFLVVDLLIVVLSWALEGTNVIRAFRVFRTLRLVTRVDTMKNLVIALFSVFPKMAAIFMLLLLIFYIYGVMFTILFKGLYEPDGDGIITEPWFEGLAYSFFTLFQIMTFDTWAAILVEYQHFNRWAWMPFVSFVIMTGFIVVNLIIAVICDAVHVLGDEDKMALQGNDNLSPRNHPMQAASIDEGDPNKFAEQPYPASDDRLRDLTMKLDEMMRVQEQMQKTMIRLAQRLIEERGQRKEQQAHPEHNIRSRPPREEEQSRIPEDLSM